MRTTYLLPGLALAAFAIVLLSACSSPELETPIEPPTTVVEPSAVTQISVDSASIRGVAPASAELLALARRGGLAVDGLSIVEVEAPPWHGLLWAALTDHRLPGGTHVDLVGDRLRLTGTAPEHCVADLVTALEALPIAVEVGVVVPADPGALFPNTPIVVHFETGSALIEESQAAVLDGILPGLAAFPEVRVEVVGHTDSRGENHDRLSMARAESARDLLVASGVDPRRIDIRAAGDSEPVVTGQQASTLAINRRAELHLIDVPAPPSC